METPVKRLRKEKEFLSRRAEIHAQAVRIFSRKGFHETTMAEIAEASGFSTGSLYQFFRGKEDLYTSMVKENLQRMYAFISNAVSSGTTVPDRIRALVESHFRFAEDNADFYRVLLGYESGMRTEGLTQLRDYTLREHRNHLSYIESLIVEGVTGRMLRPLESRTLARVLAGIIMYFKFSWTLQPPGSPLSEKVDDVMDVFMRGAAVTGMKDAKMFRLQEGE